MSFKTSLVKTAIKLTPNKMVAWAANIILKGIATISEFNFDLDTRKIQVTATLYGETEPIEVWVDGFAIVSDGESNKFFIEKAESNKPWLKTIFAKLVGKEWKIPHVPKYSAYINIIVELLKPPSSSSDAVEIAEAEPEQALLEVAATTATETVTSNDDNTA